MAIIEGVHFEDSSETQANKERLEQQLYALGKPYIVCFPAVYSSLSVVASGSVLFCIYPA